MKGNRIDMFIEIRDLVSMIRKSSSNPELKYAILPTLETGFKMLDYVTGGLAAGDYIILAGRPCTGKTIFALNISLHTALASGKDSLIFSLSSTREMILKNLFTIVTGFPASIGPMSAIPIKDLARLVKRSATVLESDEIGQFFVYDEMNAIDEIEKEILERKSKSQLGLVVIDYLQLCENKESPAERSAELVSISRCLRKLSKKTMIPFIVLSSVNSNVDGREYNKRPTLTDINAPGEIVDDCDMVWMLYRDELYDRCEDNPNRGAVDLAILKNRRGKSNLIELTFVEEMHRFEDTTSF
jgi:replicative DNA helicase